jgi:glycosyltransferase involved in cell wall biosynthesis
MLSSQHRHDDVRIYHKETRALMAADYPVMIACPGPAPRGLDARTLSLSLPDGRLGRMATGWTKGMEAAVQSGAKIVHLHDPELLPAGLLLRLLGKQVVYDAHEDLPLQIVHKPYLPSWIKPTLSEAVRMGEGLMARQLDLVVGATPAIARRLGGVVVRNLPDPDELLLPRLPRRPRQACYVGLISAQRGILTCIEAAAQAGFHLMIAGEVSDPRFAHHLSMHPLRKHFTLLGRLDRQAIGRLLAQSSCGLCMLGDFPAYRQAIPIKLLEYMLAGLPFVASDFAGYRNLGGHAGLYAPPGDAGAVAAAMMRLRDDPHLWERLSEHGRSRAAYFTFEAEARRLVDAYIHLGKGQRGRMVAPLSAHPNKSPVSGRTGGDYAHTAH